MFPLCVGINTLALHHPRERVLFGHKSCPNVPAPLVRCCGDQVNHGLYLGVPQAGTVGIHSPSLSPWTTAGGLDFWPAWGWRAGVRAWLLPGLETQTSLERKAAFVVYGEAPSCRLAGVRGFLPCHAGQQQLDLMDEAAQASRFLTSPHIPRALSSLGA